MRTALHQVRYALAQSGVHGMPSTKLWTVPPGRPPHSGVRSAGRTTVAWLGAARLRRVCRAPICLFAPRGQELCVERRHV